MYSPPRSSRTGNPFNRLMGIVCFLVILPFGLIFGLLHGVVDLRKPLRVGRPQRQGSAEDSARPTQRG